MMYTKRYVNIVSLIITIIIFISTNQMKNFKININSISNIFKRNSVLVELSSNNINQETKEDTPLIENKSQNNNITEEKNTNWKLMIPKISLEAEIEETTKTSGNVGLAAHNRGYPVNYFTNIKQLKEGDEIIYKYYEFEKTYLVVENKIIKDTDWEPLEGTKENKITLITCVENEPEYRRCIQAVEK